MRLRHFMFFCVFVLVLIFIPHIIEISYNSANPIIIWNYSQSDILNYSAVAIGIFIAMLALFLAIDENRVKIKFDIASSLDEEGDLCFEFRIINNSKVYCKMEQFGFSHIYKPIKLKVFGHTLLIRRLKGQKRIHSVISPPFELQPGECHDVVKKYKEIKRTIEQLYDENEKIELFVSFVTWKYYYKTANEIRNLISNNYTETENYSNG